MNKWIVQEGVMDTIHIKEDNKVFTPVATVAVPIGWKDNHKWKHRALSHTNMIAAAPVMLDALKTVKKVMDLEHPEPDMDKLYEIVIKAIKEASYEPDTPTTKYSS